MKATEKYSAFRGTVYFGAQSEQCFPVVLFVMLYNVVVTFESVDEILKCDHSNLTAIDT